MRNLKTGFKLQGKAWVEPRSRPNLRGKVSWLSQVLVMVEQKAMERHTRLLRGGRGGRGARTE